MSEQKSFMQLLDEWTNATVIVPLTRAVQEQDEDLYHTVTAGVEKAIREKVLESYRNGLKAQPRKPAPGRKELNHAGKA